MHAYYQHLTKVSFLPMKSIDPIWFTKIMATKGTYLVIAYIKVHVITNSNEIKIYGKESKLGGVGTNKLR